MPSSLHVLLLEDSPADAELMVEELRQAGFEPNWQRVQTESEYLAQLDKLPDLILADYSLPQFDGLRALQLLKGRGLDIPFIIVSGCIGEEVAVQCMKDGAADYLLKDRLTRLGQAVGQALDRKRLLEEKRQAEERLFHEAYHDALTGLPNRALFLDRLRQAIVRGKRDDTYSFAVLFMNLDGFNVVNDSLGPPVGDRLLVEVGQRLALQVRSVDTVARLGGDEFAVLLDDLKAVSNAPRVANRLQQEFAKPFNLEGRDVFMTASIGIADSTAGYERTDDVLRDAGAAMYRAKRLGKACFVMFDPAMHTQAMARLQLEADLRQALEHDEFRLDYQPIISLGTGSVTGFEALLRWQHPERGLVAPLEYLAVAEEIGLILRLGRWVLREACHQLRVWLVQFPMIQQLTMSVNLSGTDFLQSDLIKVVEETLVETGLDSSCLKLEITETVIMDNAEAATATLQAFKARQIETCIDDFGTGYSSLSYLQQFPIDILKIDKSFVTQMEADANSFEIIRTIVTLAHSLGKKVIAEGIETAGQLALLKALKCEYGQGFFFSGPLPQKAVHAFMAADHTW